jgi:formylglycine-generating enzyme required for sulfatase activity
MIGLAVTRVFMGILFMGLLACPTASGAQQIDELKKGVVEITAQTDGKTKQGTGFIVRLEKDAAYIVTASHVIEGDPQPTVVFRGKESKGFPARVKGTKGGDPRGMAVLVVLGDLPQGIGALPMSADFEINGGEEVTVIGFPRKPAVRWAVTPGVVTGQEGEYLVFSGAAAEGNSGGPVLRHGQVVGVVTEVLSQYGYAVPIPILRLALRGWGVSLDAPPTVANRVPEEKNEKEPLRREITGKDGASMVLIPAGSFLMGSTKDEVERAIKDCVKELEKDQQTCEGWFKPELPQHKVQMGAFYFDTYEVTNRRFQQFARQTGYRTTAEREGSARAFVEGKGWEDVKGAHWQKPEAGPTVFDSNRAEHPVVAVSWDDAQAYCRWAEKRLPTEAEWEYAARAGTMTTYWWGQGNPGSRRVENIADESAKKLLKNIMSGYDDGSARSAPVGSYEANPWGLHDISGNVAEWTADWYGEEYYGKSPARNPTGPSGGEYRVVRGGSWLNVPALVRSAGRGRNAPTARLGRLGFRCAQDVPK